MDLINEKQMTGGKDPVCPHLKDGSAYNGAKYVSKEDADRGVNEESGKNQNGGFNTFGAKQLVQGELQGYVDLTGFHTVDNGSQNAFLPSESRIQIGCLPETPKTAGAFLKALFDPIPDQVVVHFADGGIAADSQIPVDGNLCSAALKNVVQILGA